MTGTVRRVFTGPHPLVFTGLGRVVPGQEIDVPAELADGFDRRADIARPRKRKAKTASTAAGGMTVGQQAQDTAGPASRGD